jgi:CRP-like cAMP-binding protein
MARFSGEKAGHTGNRLLDRLPAADLTLLAGHFELIHLSSRQILFQEDDPLENVFFPVSAVLSLNMSPTPLTVPGFEIASVGNEGVAGFTALLGVPTSFHEAACQVPGDCLRLAADFLAETMAHRSAIDSLLKKYVAVASRTFMQAAVCSALHEVEQRVCRWLLTMHEKAAKEVPVTHDILAARLGVKHPTVSLVANALLRNGLISYHRGIVRILDQTRLEQAACDCFQITKAAYEKIIER